MLRRLLKTSRVQKRNKRVRATAPRIRPLRYADLADDLERCDGGSHVLGELALCQMQGVAPDGYYVEIASIPLASS